MLQGSLDNFALQEVLGMLSSTSKTGQLSLHGDRGTGSLALHEGRLAAANASNTTNGIEPDAILFELLRFETGTFSFEVGEVADADHADDVGKVLAAAEARLADWRMIEAVVPSLDHAVFPIDTLPTEEVTIDRGEWATLVVVAAGCSVSKVCDELGLSEVEGSRKIKDLAERGLVTVRDPIEGEVMTGAEPSLDPPRDPFARRAARGAAVASEAPDPFSSSLRTGSSAAFDNGAADPASVLGAAPVAQRPQPPPAVSNAPNFAAVPAALGGAVAQPPPGLLGGAEPASDPADANPFEGLSPSETTGFDPLALGPIGTSGPAEAEGVVPAGLDPDNEGGVDGDGKPSGLLKRYLQSED